MMRIYLLDDIPTLPELYQTGEMIPSFCPRAPPSSLLNALISLHKGDLTKIRVDAIVNPANSALLGGSGVDGAVHLNAGPGLAAELEALGGRRWCPTGDAVVTLGHDLPAQHVIHVVGPVYGGHFSDEEEAEGEDESAHAQLARCYRRALEVAGEKGCRTVAFACVSTGVYGYPSMEAARVACKTVRRYLDDKGELFDRIVFVVFEERDWEAYEMAIPLYFPPER